jgi:hypothetical protein
MPAEGCMQEVAAQAQYCQHPAPSLLVLRKYPGAGVEL